MDPSSLLQYLINSENSIRIEADMKSDYLNLNELLTLDFRKGSLERENGGNRYHLGISPSYNFV